MSDDSILWLLLWRSGWSDATGEDERSPPIHCLFCAEVNREWPDMEDHMKVGIIFVLQFSEVILFLGISVLAYSLRLLMASRWESHHLELRWTSTSRSKPSTIFAGRCTLGLVLVV